MKQLESSVNEEIKNQLSHGGLYYLNPPTPMLLNQPTASPAGGSRGALDTAPAALSVAQLPAVLQLAQVSALAQDLNFAFFEIDCSKAKSRSALLKAIARVLDFPDHFGSNLDALYDCLTDAIMVQSQVGVIIVMRHIHADDAEFHVDLPHVMEVFQDAIDYVSDYERILSVIWCGD